MSQMTTIAVQPNTRDELKQYGTKGETYDEILQHLMRQVDYEMFMERQYKRAGEIHKFVALDEI